MISVRWAVSDSATLVGRSLRHSSRNFDALLLTVFLPVMILLLFVYVFGGAIQTGDGRYVTYVVPGIVLLCAGYGAATTATSVANDLIRGVVDRFRSLPIVASAVLTGHVVASVARNLLSVALLLAVAVMIGFRPTTDPARWLGAAGLLILYVLAISWLSVVFGLLARSVEGAGGFSFFILFMPYVSSAFVPTDTMPAALRVIAEHQPITPVTETLRGLLLEQPIGSSGPTALAWCAALLTGSYLTARWLFNRRGATPH
jgi:ABC-2 type transport system permease protein